MRKNKFMRAASGLLVAVLLTTCVISGTFAKYVTSAEGSDTARVAKWGFNAPATIQLDLFSTTPDGNVQSGNNEKVIAPGTEGSASFDFSYAGQNDITAPEVAYTFEVSTAGSNCGNSIQTNPNIKWALDGTDDNSREWGTWTQLLTKIDALDGNKAGNKYEANQLPEEFKAIGNNTHTVYWKWDFEGNNNDTTDTEMGNATNLEDVKLNITITATQVD